MSQSAAPPETKVDVVYVMGRGSDDDAAAVYKDGRRVYAARPVSQYGSNLEDLVEALLGVKATVHTVKQTGQTCPDKLEEILGWGEPD